jgi:hypothetical protein
LKKILLAAVIVAASSTTHAQALDYAQYKSSVEPIFLKKRAGHSRCIVCHSDRSGNSLKLESLTAGQKAWSEEQSRRNFETVSRLVVPGKPESSLLLMYPLAPEAGGGAYHSGGRQFESKDDPDWKAIARWASGG